VQSAAGKESCNRIALKRGTNTETRWNRKLSTVQFSSGNDLSDKRHYKDE